MIILFSILELIKRPIFWVLYPIAYLLRDWCRTYKTRIDPFYADRIYTRPDNIFKWLFWIVLDDSIRMETGKEYCETKRSSWVEWLPEGWFKEFARSFFWGAWRNNGINWSWVACFGQFTGHIFMYQFTSKSYYRILRYGKDWALPQIQIWMGNWRFQAGWLTCGRYEFEFRKYEVV